MSEGTHVDDLLGAFMDGELDAPTHARVEAHLRACARCAEELASWRRLDAQLSATDVPDPGAAYWSRFAARVQARLPVTAAPRAPWVERVVGWFVPAERIAWARVAGAFAVVTLVTYVGMRGFEPDRIQRRDGELQRPRATGVRPDVPEGDAGLTPSRAPKEVSAAARAATEAAPRGATDTQRAPVVAESGAAKRAPGVAAGGVADFSLRAHPESVPAPEPSPTAQGVAPEFAKAARTGPEAGAHAPGQAPARDSVGGVKADLAEPLASSAAAKTASPLAGAAPMASGTSMRAALPRADGVEAAVRTFVAAALAGDTLAARVQRDAVAAAAASAVELQHMDAWLHPMAPLGRESAAVPSSQTEAGLSALDALVWPRREQPALRPHVELLARRLLDHADDPQQRERAVAYAQWLAQTSPDAARRSLWQALLDALQP